LRQSLGFGWWLVVRVRGGEERLIDHVWVDGGGDGDRGGGGVVVREDGWEVGTLPDVGKEPRGPWGEGDGGGGGDGSDHAWIRVDLSVVVVDDDA